MNQRQLGVLLPIVASLAIFGGAPWVVAQSAQPLPIRIGFTRVGSLAPIMVALKKGLYREAGLEASAVTGAGGPENLQALLGGSVDVAIAVAGPIARALDQGAPLVGIARFASGGDRYAVVTGARSGIGSLDDLRGKRIGYTFGTLYEMMIKAILRERRLSDRDITPVNLRILDAPAALQANQVDAVLTIEPNSTQLERGGIGHILVRGQAYVGGADGFIVTTRDFLRAHRETLRRFLVAHYRAMQDLRQDNPLEVARLIREYMPASQEETIAAGNKWVIWDPRIVPKVVDDMQAELAFYHSVKAFKARLDLGAFFETGLQDEVVKAHQRSFSDCAGACK